MKINIKSVGFEMDSKTKELVETKISKLEKYYDKITSVDVYLKEENISDKENKLLEVRVFVPGGDIVVKKHAETFRKGIDYLMESLKKTIKRKKEKESGR